MTYMLKITGMSQVRCEVLMLKSALPKNLFPRYFENEVFDSSALCLRIDIRHSTSLSHLLQPRHRFAFGATECSAAF